MTRRLCLFIILLSTSSVQPAFAQDIVPLETILERMMAHNEWQGKQLVEYQTIRTFYAANPRFKIDSTMLVETTFKKPETVDSKILKHEGSNLIREHVFAKIIEAENETRSAKAKREVDITPANYNFKLSGMETCGDRTCYRLALSPKRRDKYSIKGEVWIDSEDFAIARLHGAPAKRPSLWTRHTEIERRYTRVNGIWLTEKIESISDIVIAGQSHLSIDYSYNLVETAN